MATTIRTLANCIGVSEDISVLRHFIGFIRGVIPGDPTGVATEISLLEQARLMQRDHFHVNVIRVGSDQFEDPDHEEIDYSIYRLRNIYGAENVGVGRVEHYRVLTADADGLDAPNGKSEVEEITERWFVANDGIDIFIPFDMSNAGRLGRSVTGGPCEDKENKGGMDASVAGIWGKEQTSRTFAHELGHYLGLDHENDRPENLMAQSGEASSIRDSVELRNSQVSEIRDHCLMDGGC